MFLVDQGITKKGKLTNGSLLHYNQGKEDLAIDKSKDDVNSARIYLNTLASFTDDKAGTYTLSSLKKMTGTDNFLGQSDEQKKCMKQTSENCHNRKYFENVQDKCGCVPWAVSSSRKTKVFVQAEMENV